LQHKPIIISHLDKVHGEREVIPPDDIVESIDIQEEIHKEYGQSGVDKNPLVHPCLTSREGGKQIIPTCGKGQGEDI